MNYLDNNLEGLLMDQMREQDEDMATQIQDLMFVFNGLCALSSAQSFSNHE
jgi:flagellar motor switch protein FliG